MSETLRWWLMMQVVAVALLPLCLALFRRLPDRGYSFSKAFGLLLVGYVFWILGTIRILPNSAAGIWWVVALFAAASGFVLWRSRDEVIAFVRSHLWLIASVEALFFLAFVTAAYLRSYVPDINQTEQPMDFMFLNAVTRADHFPPEDPWLAGNSVAYYYFGYLLVSIVTRLSGLAASVGYNLGLSMIVALATVGAFGLVYNLAALREGRGDEAGSGAASRDSGHHVLWRPIIFGAAAALLLVAMGSMEGVLEWIAAHGIGSDGFWSALNIRTGVNEPFLTAYDSGQWYPDKHLFWWQATRLIQTSDGLFGIHEFPFFSFLLGDLHPHVMSIPFILLAAGGALALLRSEGPLDVVFWLERPLWLAALAVMLGALAFLNTWDMPTIAFAIFLIALLRNRLLSTRWSWGLVGDTVGFALPLFAASFLAYIPFFFGGFDSQASGFKADSFEGTNLLYALLIWGPLAALTIPYAAWRLSRSGRRVTISAALWALAPAAALIVLWAGWDLVAQLGGWLPDGIRLNESAEDFWSRVTARDWGWLTAAVLGSILGLFVLALVREVEAAGRGDCPTCGTTLLEDARFCNKCGTRVGEQRLSHVFALALSSIAVLLLFGAEFFFLQDQFNARMNTVFKLYYQAWILLSVAAGFALYEMTRGWQIPVPRPSMDVRFQPSLGNWSAGELGVAGATLAGATAGVVLMQDTIVGLRIVGALIGAGLLFTASAGLVVLWRATEPPARRSQGGALTWRAVWASGAAVLVLAAFVYPVLASYNRTAGFAGERTLDGLAYLRESSPSEYAAIQWLSEREGRLVVAEATGQGYRVQTSRASGTTGFPTILGWPGHESQWRGGYEAQEGREEDLLTLYTSTDPNEVRSIIQKYEVTHIFLGPAERAAYGETTVAEMTELFEPVFPESDPEGAEVVIYRFRGGDTSRAANP